jgi:MFS family permease
MQPPPWGEDGGRYANDRIGSLTRPSAGSRPAPGPPWPTASRRCWPATTRPCSTTGCTPAGPATSSSPTGSPSDCGPGCDHPPVVGPAAAADHVVAAGLDLRQPGGRRTAIIADALSLVTVLALVVALVVDFVFLWLSIVTQVLGLLFDGPGMVARDALVPRAATLRDILQNTALFVGPLAAGLLIAGLERQRPVHDQPLTPAGALADVREGFRFIVHEPLLGPLAWLLVALGGRLRPAQHTDLPGLVQLRPRERRRPRPVPRRPGPRRRPRLAAGSLPIVNTAYYARPPRSCSAGSTGPRSRRS